MALILLEVDLGPKQVSVGAAGYFARDSSVLRRVGDVLLDPSTRSTGPLKRWLVGKDAFDLAEDASRRALYQVLEHLPCIDCWSLGLSRV